jgi:hypothetical protein
VTCNARRVGSDMAVRAYTENPDALLSAIKKEVASGAITTWIIDNDGDLTHASKQWTRKAWMRPKILEDRLLFNIIGRKEEKMSRTVYGVYHGRLIQTLLIHFDSMIETAVATAAGTSGDLF